MSHVMHVMRSVSHNISDHAQDIPTEFQDGGTQTRKCQPNDVVSARIRLIDISSVGATGDKT